MIVERVKCLMVAAFSVLALTFSATSFAQHPSTDPHDKDASTSFQQGNKDSEKPKGGNEIDAAEVIELLRPDG